MICENKMATRPRDHLTIDIALRNKLFDTIKKGVEERFFNQGGDHIRMVKIAQNIGLQITALLGRTIKKDRVDTYIQEYVARYILSVVRIGEPVGVIAAQSLNQPIVQSVLKSQHRTGAKETTAANSLVMLNKMGIATRIIKVHLLNNDTRKVTSDERLQTLSRLYEEVKLDDVLSSTFGNSKYTPDQASKFYSQELTYMYINHRHTTEGEIVYRFQVDASKLDDAGLTIFDIYEILTESSARDASFRDVMIVLHPMTALTFDLVPGGKPLTAFLDMIKKLMQKCLKGIPGLISISERKVSTTQIVARTYYDEQKDETYFYLSASMMTLFPVHHLKKYIKGGQLIHEITRLHHLTRDTETSTSFELFHLVYKGNAVVEKYDYIYYLFMGTLTAGELLGYATSGGGDFGDLVDRRYLVSNDPHEMIEMLGKTAARTIHEYNYSEELIASKTPLLYQHINTVCREMFGLRTNPITPVSYMRSKETNALDKFGYQNYRQNLEREIIKGNKSTNEEMPSAVMTGRRAKLGTGYIRLTVDNARRQEIIEQYSEARQRQKYLGEYKDIDIPKLGELKPITTFTMRPFGQQGLPNRNTLGI